MADRSKSIPDEWRQLLENIGSPFGIVRDQAYASLCQYPEPPLSVLLEALCANRKSWRWQRAVQPIFAVIVFFSIIAISDAGHLYYSMILPLAPFIYFTVFALQKPPENYQQVLRLVARRQDIRSINNLIEGLVRADNKTRSAVSSSIQSILLRLTPADAGLITSKSRQTLYYEMTGNDGWLIRAILLALPLLEDGGSLPNLEALADGKVPDQGSGDIIILARKLLPVVREFASRTETSATLLRAHSSDDILETSLRASAAPAKVEELLRSSQQ